jgi:phosphoserine aminotransferase
MDRVFNFNPGPATLPVEILKEAASELVNFKGTGMSIMEHSHRGKDYEAVHNETIADIRSLFGVPENFDILFLQGGASSQFFMVPMNLLGDNDTADYILTGAWSEKALKEAEILGKKVNVIATAKGTNFDRIPAEFKFTNGAKYVHITTNNTIFGTQWKSLPDTKGIPLVIDASSDVFSYPIDWKNVGILYAGAQKNAGPAGVTITIIRKDLVKTANAKIPTMLQYSTHSTDNSLYNTPPTFVIYMIGLNMKWLKSKGGIKEMQKINEEKAKYIYDAIDNSNGFYKGHAQKDSRSLMNITFTLKNPENDEKFVKEASAKGLKGLKGHRSVGGMRASVYNAMPVEGCKTLAEFMADFAKHNS